jgi:hypothetical protein
MDKHRSRECAQHVLVFLYHMTIYYVLNKTFEYNKKTLLT